MARPGRLELPTLCLEGRRSIQLSYGRTINSDSKAFTTRINTFGRIDLLPNGQKLCPTEFLAYSIDSTKVATPIRHPTSSAITEQVGAIGMGGTMNQSQLTLLPQTKLEFQIQARVSV